MSVISAGTTTTTAFKVTGDTTGTLQLKTGAVPTTAIDISASQVVTFPATTTLDFTGALLLGDGSATAPTLAHSGDTNTGIYFPGADQIAITTAGTQRVYVGSTGNVGIGTGSPSAKLQVGDGTATTEIRIDGDGGAGNGGFVRGYKDTANASWYLGDLNPIAGGTNDGMCAYVYGANPFALFTNGTEKFRIDSAGNAGLGVTPSAWSSDAKALQFPGGSLSGFQTSQTNLTQNAILNAASNFVYVTTAAASAYRQISGVHSWNIAPSGTAGNTFTFTQAMTLDASGRLGVGATSPVRKVDVVETAGSTDCWIRVLGGSGSTLGGVIFGNNDGGTLEYAKAYWNNASNDFVLSQEYSSGSLIFRTNSTERARIGAGGNIFLNGSTVLNGFGSEDVTEIYYAGGSSSYLAINNAGANAGIYASISSSASGTGATTFFSFSKTGTQVGTITTNGSATAYNTSSDRRLKNNIAPADNAGSVIDAIEVVKHDWKVGGHVRCGVIAQDLYAIVPEAVTVGDADDVEEFKNPWGVDYSKLVPMLVKELQSVRARLAALEGN
jgi:hypothetical protein